MKRIAFLRINQETNAFSSVLSEESDFRKMHWKEGAELREACGRLGTEVEGFARNLELSGFLRSVRKHGGGQIQAVPLFSAWAVPGGPMTAECFEGFKTRIREELEAALPLDGVFFTLHGAMGAVGEQDPEGVFLELVREVVGPDVPVAITLDLHCQLTPRMVANVDILAAYRTNPHRDHAAVGFRAGRILIDTVLGKVRPTSAWRTLPMVMGGGTTIDLAPTMRPIFQKMKELEKDPRVLYCSLLMCHIWCDDPNLGWSTHVVTDDDPLLADRLADELADAAWGVRNVEPPEFSGALEAIERVRSARRRKVLPGTACVCDASDIVGAGATGENTRLLRALYEEATDLVSYAPIRDPGAAERLFGLVGAGMVKTELGGTLQPEVNTPVEVRGRVLFAIDHENFGKTVVLDCDHVKIVITTGPPLAMKPAFYRDLGLDPWKADICVVKSMFPFRLYFLGHNRLSIYVKTEGNTDLDAPKRLTFNHPVHPLAAVEEWRTVDRIRRGMV